MDKTINTLLPDNPNNISPGLSFPARIISAMQARIQRRRRALAWLLAVTGATAMILMLLAMLFGSRATHASQDAAQSGSLCSQCLEIYEATQQHSEMLTPRERQLVQVLSDTRARLHADYPKEVEATDPAWNAFAGTLQQTGKANWQATQKADWQVTQTFCTAADTLTRSIRHQAVAEDNLAATLARLGLSGLLCWLVASGFLLSRLRAAEAERRQALANVQNSRDLFLRSINAVQEGYVVQDWDGTVLLCNAEAEYLLGVPVNDLMGQSAERRGWQFVRENGEEFPRSQDPSRLALETGQPQEAVVLGLLRPGTALVWLSMKAAPVFYTGEARPYAAVLTFTDITDKKRIKAELKKQEENLLAEREFQKAMLESLQDGIVACDANGTLTLFNRAAREFYGLPAQPLPSVQWAEHFDQWAEHSDLFQPDGITPLEAHETPLFRASAGEVVQDAEMVIAPIGRSSRTLLASGQAIYSHSGQKIGAVVAMHDITTRRMIEREVSRLAAIVESAEEAILATTLDGTLVSWNAAAERLYGYAESEVIGQHVSVLVPSGEVSPVEETISSLLQGERVKPVEVVCYRRNGEVHNIDLTFSPIHNAECQIIGLSCIARDVTARREAENALRESEARLRYLSDAAFEGIAVSRNGVMVDANAAFLTLYGYETLDQLVGVSGVDLAAPESRALVTHKIASGKEDTYEALCRRLDGSTFQAEVRGRSVLWDGQPARVTAVRDITERKAMEEKLSASHRTVQESEARLVEAQRIARIGSWEYDLVENKITWSDELFRLFGLDPAMGEPDYAAAVALYDPEDAPRLDALVTRAAQEGIGYTLDLRGAPSSEPDVPQKWYHTAGNAATNESGQVVRLVGTLVDITERKAMEEELRASRDAVQQSETRLAKAQRIAKVGSWEHNPFSGETVWSGQMFRLLGRDPEAGTPDFATAMAHYHPEDSPLLKSLVARAAQDGIGYEMDVRGNPQFSPDDSVRWLHTTGEVIRDAAGRVTRLTGTLADITERKAMEDALQESQRFAQSIAQNSASLIFVFDLETRTNVYANRNLNEFLGYDPGDMTAAGIELLPAVVHPDDVPSLLSHIASFGELKDNEVVEFEYRVRHASGEWRWIWSREVVFKRRPDGSPWHILGNAQDVTARRETEEALRHSEEALRAMLSSAPIILWAADTAGTFTMSEGRGLAAMGIAPGEAVGRSVFEFTGGDPLVISAMRRALTGETVSYDTRFGGFCVHAEIRPQYDASGAISGIIGVSFDVTERAQSEERFRVLFEQSSEAHLLLDENGIIDCNSAALTIMRCSDKSELVGKHPALLSPKCQPDGRLSSEKDAEMTALARQNGSHRFEWMRLATDGTEFPVEVTLTEVMLNEKPLLLSVWHDLTERKLAEQQIKDYMVVLEFQKTQLEQTNEELEALATTDGLTGLKNHRTFQQKLAEEHSRAGRYHQPLSLLLLDVDHFKQYNDSFGHPAGDAVLRSVAATLSHTARDTDIVARYGGEEFVVILPQTNEAGAMVIAERLRNAIAGGDWEHRPVTVSVGVCTLTLDTPTPESLVACADQALYHSKETGRNRVTHGNPEAPLVCSPAQKAGVRSAGNRQRQGTPLS